MTLRDRRVENRLGGPQQPASSSATQASLNFDYFKARVDPNWVTLTPDGKTAYVAMAGSNFVAAIDVKSMKQVARIPVGYVPKRNATAILP